MKDVKKIRRLPGYWLGTRRPTDLGYQPANLLIGTPEFTSVQGEDVTPEVNAIRSNLIPEGILKSSLNAQYVASALQNYTSAASAAAANAAANANLARTGSILSEIPGSQAVGLNMKALGESGKGVVSKAGLTTAGKVTAGIGAAAGLYSIYNDIQDAYKVRNAGDMAKTMATNTYYTPGGHAYTKHSGLNMQGEMDYADAQKNRSRLNLLLDSMGTGASAGLLIGGSSAGPYGALIGTGVGALIAGGANLLGYGDITDETRRQALLAQEVIQRSDKLSEALAKNLDTREGFYNGNGRYGAKYGKRPVFSAFGPVDKKATARVSNGELIGNFKYGYVSEVPGKPNNKDSKLAWLRPSDFVISNKFGLSDYAKATGDYAGALDMQDILMTLIKGNYKCGKKPKYALGTAGEYALATLPHLGQYFQSLASYNRAKNADTYVPQMEIQSPMQTAAINQVMSDRIDPREYFKQSDKLYNLALWNNRRNPGLGYGGRAIFGNDLYGKKLAADADLWVKAQEAERAQRNTGANMKFTLGDKMLSTWYDQFWKRLQLMLYANAAKENWMELDNKNMVMAGINSAADLLRLNQYNKANDIQNKLISLYDNLQNLEWYKASNQFPGAIAWNPTLKVPRNWYDSSRDL